MGDIMSPGSSVDSESMTIRELLAQQNPHAMFYPERYDEALVGMTWGFGAKQDSDPVAAYARQKLIDLLAEEFAEGNESDEEDCDPSDHRADAEEWVDTNMLGGRLGPDAPVILITRVASDTCCCSSPCEAR